MTTIPLHEYFDESRPVRSYVDELSDTEKIPDHQGSRVDILCLGLAQRLLLNALGTSGNEVTKKIKPSKLMAFECIADVRSTAALLKELAFEERFAAAPGGFIETADIGMGHGALTVAAVIAARRKQIGIDRICCYGFDRDEELLEDARVTLNELEVAHDLRVQDVREPALYTNFLATSDVRFWITETFRNSTPACTVYSAGLITSATERFDQSDPFPTVIGHLSQHIPLFTSNVRNEISALFPDVVNGLYRPHTTGGVLNLKTAEKGHRPLPLIGQEFLHYEVISENERWPGK